MGYDRAMHALTGHRLPLLVLAVVFLIPVGTSSLRGLTHLLTCADEVGTFVSVTPGLEPGEPPTVLSSRLLEAGEDPLICEALVVELAIGEHDEASGAVELIVDVTNTSQTDWRGTIRLEVGTTPIPLAVGRVAAGQTERATAWVRGRDGQVEIEGELLIGP